MIRNLLILMLFLNAAAHAQNTPSFIIGVKGDTLNRVDAKGDKQGKWVRHVDELRGEPGYEEEGEYKNNRKEGPWRLYNLNSDLIGVEYYRWGNKDGVCQYFAPSGQLVREEAWRAMNPDKPYDTLEIEDIDHLDQYKTVVLKNEGVAIRHGDWKFYDPNTGMIYRTETYVLGKLQKHAAPPAAADSTETAKKSLVKPREVQNFEKKNSGKKKVKYIDGSTH